MGQDWWSQLVHASLGQQPPVGTRKGTWGQDSPGVAGYGVLSQLGRAMGQGARQAEGASSVCRMKQC